MKSTPLTSIHIGLNAKMADFAGYNMPIEYTGINDEHLCVCNRLGVFDISHMGEIWVKGERALGFIQYLMSNDASTLVDGKVQYSCLMNSNGGIVDDLLVYKFNEQKYLLVVNASNTQKDWDYISSHAARFDIELGVDLINASDSFAQLAIQGPLALKAMKKLTDFPIEEMPYYTFKEMTFAGINNAIFSTTGYTGMGGCEVYVPTDDALKLWNAVMKAGKEYGIQPIGLGARDTLRLEAGFPLYGNELGDETTPLEANLGWVTKFNKEFVGKNILEKQKQDGVRKKLVGFVLKDRGVARHGYEICNEKGEKIGEVTSGTMSPLTKLSIGMGYVTVENSALKTPIYIKVRDRLLLAEVVKPPFRDKN